MRFSPSTEQLPAVTAFLDAFLDGLACDARTRIALETVVEEVFVNIAHHSGATFAELALSHTDGEITLRFTDDGRPFDPLAMDDPDVTLPAAQRNVGGLGILMVRRMTDRQAYVRENGSNVLTLVKRCSAPTTDPRR